jgi:menaquinone-dependent protoporphyrinogen IX oxidase
MSKTGFTKKYAEWLSEELSADLFESWDVDIHRLKEYDTIIYGGGLYAGGIQGLKLIKNNLNQLKDKKIIVFGTGATPIKEETILEVKNHNFTSEQQQQIQFYLLRGGFNYDKLKALDKFFIGLLKRMLKRKEKKNTLTPDNKGMLAAIDTPVDFTRKNQIAPIVEYVKANN